LGVIGSSHAKYTALPFGTVGIVIPFGENRLFVYSRFSKSGTCQDEAKVFETMTTSPKWEEKRKDEFWRTF
jgi:hypothetical protein